MAGAAVNERIAVSDDDLDRAASLVHALEGGERLAGLIFDVLSRQAEGRSLFGGEKFVAARAEAHGVERDAAQTPLGNVLVMLERGPDSSAQWALCGALHVKGFAQAVRSQPAERKALVTRFAAHADFLELATPYRVLSSLVRVLDPELAAEVHAAIGALVLRDDARDAQPQARARNAGRIAALGDARTAASQAALQAIQASASDAFSRTLCGLQLRREVGNRDEPALHVHGRSGRLPTGPWGSLLRWLTGYGFVAWLGRLLLSGLGARREIDVELGSGGLRVLRRTRLFGRVIRAADEVHPLHLLRRARRATRYPAVHLVLGAFCFALGIVLGGVFSFDALRLHDHALAFIAVVLVFVGTGSDLLLEVIVPAGRGQVSLELDLGRRFRTQLAGVPLAEADRFLDALWQRIARHEGNAHAVD
jgi:hypothetical protein